MMGKIHDFSGSWHLPLLGCAVLVCVVAIFSGFAGRDEEISPAGTKLVS